MHCLNFLFSIFLVLSPIIEGLPSWLYTKELSEKNTKSLETNTRKDLSPKLSEAQYSNIKIASRDSIDDIISELAGSALDIPLNYFGSDETSLTSMSKLSTTLDISQISSPSSALNSPSLASLTDITTTAATPSTSSASTTVTETLELSLLPTSTALYQTLDSPLSQPSDLSTISDLPEIISSYQSIAYGNSLSPTTSSGSFDSECLLPTCVQIAPDFISSSSSNIPTISPTDTAGLITAITESVTLTISLNYGNSDVSAPFTTDASPTISSTPATDVSVSSTASQSAVPYAVCIQPSTSEIDVSNIQPTGTNQLSSSTSEIAISDVETFTTFYSVDSESPNSSSQSETQYTSSIFQSTTVLPIFATESLSSSSSLISTVSADLSVITLCSICGSNTATTITNSFETLSAPSIIPIPLSESGESSSPSSFSSIISPASQVSESPTPHVMTTVVYTEFVTIVSPSSTTGQLNYLTSFPDLLSPGIVSPPSSVDFESQSSINTLSGPSITSSLISTETSQGLLEIPTISGTSSIIISEGIVISVLPLSAISNSYTLLGSSSTINLPSFESPSTYLQPTEEATFPGSDTESPQDITSAQWTLADVSSTSLSQARSMSTTQSVGGAGPSPSIPMYYNPIPFL